MNKETLKKKCTYELYLISLLEHFEQEEKQVYDRKLKHYFKELQISIRNVLDLNTKQDFKGFESLMKYKENK